MNSEAFERVSAEYGAACERSSALSQEAAGIIVSATAAVRSAAIRGDITEAEKDHLLKYWVSRDGGAVVKTEAAAKVAARTK